MCFLYFFDGSPWSFTSSDSTLIDDTEGSFSESSKYFEVIDIDFIVSFSGFRAERIILNLMGNRQPIFELIEVGR